MKDKHGKKLLPKPHSSKHSKRPQHVLPEKEAAWERFFQLSANCKADPATVEYADTYIHAKNKFEQIYTE